MGFLRATEETVIARGLRRGPPVSCKPSPERIVMYEIKCDTHTHTLYSRHAFSTIAENVKEAEKILIVFL